MYGFCVLWICSGILSCLADTAAQPKRQLHEQLWWGNATILGPPSTYVPPFTENTTQESAQVVQEQDSNTSMLRSNSSILRVEPPTSCRDTLSVHWDPSWFEHFCLKENTSSNLHTGTWLNSTISHLNWRRRQHGPFNVTILSAGTNTEYLSKMGGCGVTQIDYALRWGYDYRIFIKRTPENSQQQNIITENPWLQSFISETCKKILKLGRLAACRSPLPWQDSRIYRALGFALLVHEQLSESAGQNPGDFDEALSNSSSLSDKFLLYMDTDAAVNNPSISLHSLIDKYCGPETHVVITNNGCTINSGFIAVRVSNWVLETFLPLWIGEFANSKESHHHYRGTDWSGDQGPLNSILLRLAADFPGVKGKYNYAWQCDDVHQTNGWKNACFERNWRKVEKLVSPQWLKKSNICVLPPTAPINHHDCSTQYNPSDLVFHRVGNPKCLHVSNVRNRYCTAASQCVSDSKRQLR